MSYIEIRTSVLIASLDKTSVRTAVQRLKIDFEQLCADGKVTAENKALMMGMLLIIELILSMFLEKITKKETQKFQYTALTNRKRQIRFGSSRKQW